MDGWSGQKGPPVYASSKAEQAGLMAVASLVTVCLVALLCERLADADRTCKLYFLDLFSFNMKPV